MCRLAGLSADGDMQGVDRLFGALSAHMWPGMILKSGNKITNPSLVEKEESTDDESDFEIEYEALSHGSDDEWGVYNDAVGTKSYNETEEINHNPSSDTNVKVETSTIPSTSIPMMPSNLGSGTGNDPDTQNNFVEKWEKFEDDISIEQRPGPTCDEQELRHDTITTDLAEDAYHGLDDLESLMHEVGNMRDNLRLMPDFQRREMAAKLAMKMAAMFADDSDDEVGL